MSTAIILAGGLGTRLRSTVPDVPKPMAPIQGRPFLEHQMDYWLAQGVKRFVLSIGYQYDVIIFIKVRDLTGHSPSHDPTKRDDIWGLKWQKMEKSFP